MLIRYIAFILSGLSVLTSCKGEPKAETAAATEEAVEAPAQSLSKYSGFWLSESYVNAIKNLKSVDSATFVYESLVLAIEITPDTISNKSANTKFYWHSESSFEKMYPDESQSLQYKPRHEGGPLKSFTLALKNPDRIEITLADTGKKECYLRFKNENQALNQLLFAEKYRDAITNAAIELTEDGKVDGIPGLITYNPVFQFDESNIEGVDVLFFYNGEKRSEKMGYDYQLAYQYKFEGDTLKLYEVPEDYGIEPGTVKYKLVKR
ncbi:hypothetical protein [uncultured Flavobacterium sp.]|uniref:hypothetical protein n=1 Tax=uncultured Flavobacterium sp. TaxID=165435 RepID=UPI0025D12193|nr:hypothetical protein [uncultured Flavobacterium sp.]